jgi:hypothetical protein
MRTNRLFAVIWRSLTATAGILGVGLMLSTAQPGRAGNLFYYFTTQSNILVVLLFLVLAAGSLREMIQEGPRGTAYHVLPSFQLGIVFYITITFLVFATLLSGTIFSMGGTATLSMILTHYVVPLMALADWLLFLPHGETKYPAAFAWLSYPLAYLAFSLLRAWIGHPSFDHGSRYPYFFIDADKLGWGNMAWIIPAFTAGFFLLGLGMIFLDTRLAGERHRQDEHDRTGKKEVASGEENNYLSFLK